MSAKFQKDDTNQTKGQAMQNLRSFSAAAICGALLLSASLVGAADVKTYQVTGPVLEVTPTSITVQKGDEKWEIARDKNTKVKGDLKVGAKVTIVYKMVAETAEVKEVPRAKK
ncbi:MAG TPA: hypothetical protein VNT26_10315 [Candidatus Sulfotelmatobacter sp.]|nr:hypothetical protein [Candidatus Sulfotelmatobacter sp.]